MNVSVLCCWISEREKEEKFKALFFILFLEIERVCEWGLSWVATVCCV